MRLKQQDIDAIKLATRAAFGETAVVRLFGSRTNDDARGGDIDLLIEADPNGEVEWKRAAAFKNELFRHIEEQKVDVVIVERGRHPSTFAALAARDAVPLP